MNLSVFSQNTSVDSNGLNPQVHFEDTTHVLYGMISPIDSLYNDTNTIKTYYSWKYDGCDTVATIAKVRKYMPNNINIDDLDGKTYGMVVDGVDTFAIIHIDYIRVANGVFVDKDYYKNLSDFLIVMGMEKDTIIGMAFDEIYELEKKNNHQIEIIDLYKEESDDCEAKYNKISKKLKKSKNANKFLGGLGGVAIIVIVVLLL